MHTLHAEPVEMGYLFESIQKNSINFLIKHGYDDDIKSFVSDLDECGNHLSKKVYVVALSRTLYAISKSLEESELYLDKAQQIVDFIEKHMIYVAPDGRKEFLIEWNRESETHTNPDQIHIWQQSYGFCGLVEFYRQTQNEAVLELIQSLLPAYIEHFQDREHGGFFTEYDRNKPSDSKSIQSTIYPVSSFMANLWDADKTNRALYEPILAEQVELAYQHAWNDDEGWINTQFAQNWSITNPAERTVSPGHNFQLAWTLLRTKDWPFIETEKKEKYSELAHRILLRTLQKPIWADPENRTQGFYELVSARGDEVLTTHKNWWQHCEAIIALNMGGERYREDLVELVGFYSTTFVDWEKGNEFPVVDSDNNPVLPIEKGSQGKSSYHTTEMLSYLLKR